ncbi:nucleotidyltransferase domain-containing protein [Parashewanella curva]|uniref:Nucleotidyltransferase domain-containing protein n=1 Tax=Parashewanella curva TaxID=2338552 RepID=A0A3L8Q193_9GAMM|nr:nucleotidyltransferase domain-containing protein [Parashewanella curva]RLV61401.1 nucleotidyltransferase domain-containing protein [Parashewanella curva]
MNRNFKPIIVKHLTSTLDNVKLIYLFGSMSNGSDRYSSDIDIAVLCNEPVDKLMLWNCAQDLAIQFGRDVDLIDLTSCSTVLAMQVTQTGELLYGSEPDDFRFNLKTMSMYQRLQEERKLIVDSFYLG